MSSTLTNRTRREIKDKMQAAFPAFFGSLTHPLPADLNMRQSFFDATSGILSGDQAGAFLNYWCNRPEYLTALTVRARRFNLEGEPCGVISAEEREAGVEKLADLLATRWMSKKKRVRRVASKRMRYLELPEDVCRRIEVIVDKHMTDKSARTLPRFGSDRRDQTKG
jgi:sRNA-binding protein